MLAQRVAGRDIDPRHAVELLQDGGPAGRLLPRPIENLDQVGKEGFAVAEGEEVDEGAQGLGVGDGDAAGRHVGLALPAVGREQRQPRQVERQQHVGEIQLAQQREPDHVEFGQRRAGLQREQRHAVLAEKRDILRVGQERPLGMDAGEAVEQVVEDLHAGVAHADGIGVGEDQADVDVPAAVLAAAGVDLPADVGLGILQLAEEFVDVHAR